MSPEEIKAAISRIRERGNDYEAAHGYEDALLWEFVEYVSVKSLRGEVKEIAEILMEWHRESVNHPRWCA